MKIAFGSDIHLEFGALTIKTGKRKAEGDVLVLAGDIFVGKNLIDGATFPFEQKAGIGAERRFLDQCTETYKNVIYIMGNHESYHGDIDETRSAIRKFTARYENFHFLDNTSIEIDGVTFFGGTLWTNMNERDPYVESELRCSMNDFRLIVKDGRTFFPMDAAREHDICLKAMKEAIAGKEKVVVISHHAPSKRSIHPRYQNDTLVNYGYHSDLNQFILDHPQIKLWIHGHTHTGFDYNIGSTRVVCNPRGYINYEPRAHKFDFQTAELE